MSGAPVDARTLAAAVAHQAAGGRPAAIALARRAVAADPKLAQARSGLGVVLSRDGHRDDGRAASTEAERMDPEDPVVFPAAAAVLAAKGLLAGAMTA